MLKAVNKYSLIFLLLIFTSGFYSYQGTIMPVGLNVYLLILIFLLIFMGSLFNVEKDRPSSLIYSRITLFSIIYLVFNCFYFIFSPYGINVWQQFVAVLAGTLFFGAIYLSSKENLEILTFFIPLLLIVSAFLNFFDFLNPGYLVPLWMPEANPGRAAGLFMNANQSAYALVLFMAFTFAFCSKKIINICLCFCLPAVLITFSRSGIALLLILLAINYRSIKISYLLIPGLTLPLFYFFGLSNFLDLSAGDASLYVNAFENILSRIDIFSLSDASTRSFTDDNRLELILLSIEEFNKSIFLGNGFGHTSMWILEMGPHNMHLFFLVEYGMLGYLFYVIAIMYFFISAFSGYQKLSKINMFLAIFLLAGGLFSHTFMIDFQPLTFLAIIACFNEKAKLKK